MGPGDDGIGDEPLAEDIAALSGKGAQGGGIGRVMDRVAGLQIAALAITEIAEEVRRVLLREVGVLKIVAQAPG